MRDDESNVNQMFQQAAGDEPSADEALARIRPRIRRAHQRRAAVRGGAGLVGVVALGAMLARSGPDGANRLHVAGTGSTVETTTVAPPPVASSSVPPDARHRGLSIRGGSTGAVRLSRPDTPGSAHASSGRPNHHHGDSGDCLRDPVGARVCPDLDV